MVKPTYKSRPTAWPTGPFILTKMVLGTSSVIILGTMAFFALQLRHDNHPVPGQLIALASVSAAALVHVFALGLVFCCGLLSPVLSMALDALLWIAWGVSWAVLGKGMGHNLLRQCSSNHWGNSKGVLICHMYKNVFSWVSIGWAALLVSFFIGVYTIRKSGPAYSPANPKSLDTSYKQGSVESDAPYGAGGTYKADDRDSKYYS